jgi:hypothetical protein
MSEKKFSGTYVNNNADECKYIGVIHYIHYIYRAPQFKSIEISIRIKSNPRRTTPAYSRITKERASNYE